MFNEHSPQYNGQGPLGFEIQQLLVQPHGIGVGVGVGVGHRYTGSIVIVRAKLLGFGFWSKILTTVLRAGSLGGFNPTAIGTTALDRKEGRYGSNRLRCCCWRAG